MLNRNYSFIYQWWLKLLLNVLIVNVIIKGKVVTIVGQRHSAEPQVWRVPG